MAFQSSNRQRGLALSIAGAASSLAAETRAAMQGKLAAYLREGEQMPDAGLLQELLGRYLEAQSQDLVAADQAYNQKVRDHRMVRQRQQAAMEEARVTLRAFRMAMDLIFGEEVCKLMVGTRDFTSRNAGVLAGILRQGAQCLRQPNFEFDPQTPGSSGRDSARMAAELDRAATKLMEITQRQVLEERTRRRVELGRKDEQLAATKEAISEASSLLKGLFIFTGKAFMARRLRPSHKKKGGPAPPIDDQA
jgi:hypothetical protein